MAMVTYCFQTPISLSKVTFNYFIDLNQVLEMIDTL